MGTFVETGLEMMTMVLEYSLAFVVVVVAPLEFVDIFE